MAKGAPLGGRRDWAPAAILKRLVSELSYITVTVLSSSYFLYFIMGNFSLHTPLMKYKIK